jgi:hypothetical protein
MLYNTDELVALAGSLEHADHGITLSRPHPKSDEYTVVESFITYNGFIQYRYDHKSLFVEIHATFRDWARCKIFLETFGIDVFAKNWVMNWESY